MRLFGIKLPKGQCSLFLLQGFEGIALGGALAKGEIFGKKGFIMGLLFTLTTPLGIAIGLFISNSFNSNDPMYLALDGIINSIASGILLYNGVVDLLVPCFSKDSQAKTWEGKLLGFFGMFLGAGAMALIAIWA